MKKLAWIAALLIGTALIALPGLVANAGNGCEYTNYCQSETPTPTESPEDECQEYGYCPSETPTPTVTPSPECDLDVCPSETPSQTPSETPSETPSPTTSPTASPEHPQPSPTTAPSPPPSPNPTETPSPTPPWHPTWTPTWTPKPPVVTPPLHTAFTGLPWYTGLLGAIMVLLIVFGSAALMRSRELRRGFQ